MPMKVARFLRQYPAIFEEFTGPQYNLPWFRLTPEAVEIDREEKRVFENCKEDLKDRLKRFILMSKGKVLPLKIIQGVQWYLGLPEDFLRCLEVNSDSSFRLVEMDDGLTSLAVESEKRYFPWCREMLRREVCILGNRWRQLSYHFSLQRV